MPPRPPPSRIAAALDYLQRLRSGVGEFVGGVGSNLADRARAAGGLAYEALTTDPNIGRMTTAEFSQAAADRAPTPRLDQAARDIGTIGRAIVTQPVETGKAIVRGEVERAQQAMTSPQAAGQYAGSLIDPTRLAAALRHRIPISELDVYHGTPHKYAPTEANPLGEFDASKIGTGEGAQAYGHGIYLAETPEVASMYRASVVPKDGSQFDLPDGPIKGIATMIAAKGDEGEKAARKLWASSVDDIDEAVRLAREAVTDKSSLYKADLPDEMIDRMLDYDKPINEQSPAVLDALERAGINTQSTALAGPMAQGQEAHLAKHGIPGLKYLDEGSRNTAGKWIAKHPQGGETAFNTEAELNAFLKRNPEMAAVKPKQTRNFVVFPGEEKKVKILERNGQPAPERIAQALEAAPTETPSSLVMPFTERKTAAGRAALKNLHKEQGVTYKDWSFERGGAHTPAGPNSGSPAFDVTMNGTYPDDFYGVNGLRYYGTGYDALDAETYMSLQKLAGRPNHPITVYRAVEKDAKGKINPGDWVTTSRAYAKEHGQSALGGNFKIVKSTVYAKDIWTSGDSMLEWGYHPQGKVPEIKWR